ncbi:MAG: HAD-IC family P-type ATPase, partial [Candidatus Nealsonbacteria bacterium]|nr:HAD-IC family P-type ATPase [Candidatus Nealsonbacteria bacterium]
ARVEPHHKMRIIEAWQKSGQVVAMTGDGINDSPALKKADIGVALGSGTDVAKEVSDLVLLTDNFNVILSAVAEGRVIIDNIRKVITYLLSDSFTETILIGASILFGWPLAVSAVQILWINLIEDGLPNVALAFEPKEKDVLDRKPEGKEIKLLTKEMKVIIFVIGLFTDFILLGIFWWLLRGNYDIQYARTIIFAALGIDSLFYVFSCKSLRRNIWRINIFSNKYLVVAVLFGFIMLFTAIYLPAFQALLKTVPLGIKEWLVILGLGAINILLIELVKYIAIIKRKNNKI